MRSAATLLLAGLVASALPAAARAQPAAILLEFGEKTGNAVLEPGAEVPEGGLSPTHTLYNSEFVTHSDQIEAALCRRFGITAIILLRPGESFPTAVTSVIHYPKLTRPDGASSDHVSFPVPVAGGVIRAVFGFDQRWEMAPGAWEFAFYDGDRELLSKTFTVHPPLPNAPRSVCAPTS